MFRKIKEQPVKFRKEIQVSDAGKNIILKVNFKIVNQSY